MGDKTGISWTDATWAPARGCSRISEGCRNCYAERIAARFSKPGQAFHGFAQMVAPRDLLDRTGGRRNGWTRKVEFQPDQLAIPLRWKKPRRIFCSSMTDIFHESLSNEEIAAIFGVMAACPQHIFQVLTKRAKRMREWFEWFDQLHGDLGGRIEVLDEIATAALSGHYDLCHLNLMRARWMDGARIRWPLQNVWIGVSVENQAAADERIPELLLTPAAVRFISAEPLLGPLRLQEWFCRERGLEQIGAPRGIHWLIGGCESGPGARPCEVEWLRSLRDQCASAGVAFWLKQAEESADLGADRLLDFGDDDSISFDEGSKLKARRKGGNHIIELPYLDGIQHANFPEVP